MSGIGQISGSHFVGHGLQPPQMEGVARHRMGGVCRAFGGAARTYGGLAECEILLPTVGGGGLRCRAPWRGLHKIFKKSNFSMKICHFLIKNQIFR